MKTLVPSLRLLLTFIHKLIFKKNLKPFCVVLILVSFCFVSYYLFKLRKEIYEKFTKIRVHSFEQKIPQVELYKNPPVLE
jgi:hypothetical protein